MQRAIRACGTGPAPLAADRPDDQRNAKDRPCAESRASARTRAQPSAGLSSPRSAARTGAADAPSMARPLSQGQLNLGQLPLAASRSRPNQKSARRRDGRQPAPRSAGADPAATVAASGDRHFTGHARAACGGTCPHTTSARLSLIRAPGRIPASQEQGDRNHRLPVRRRRQFWRACCHPVSDATRFPPRACGAHCSRPLSVSLTAGCRVGHVGPHTHIPFPRTGPPPRDHRIPGT